MRIGIDVRYLSHGLVGGVHTYVRHLIPALLEQATAHTVFLYADAKRTFELAELPDFVTLRTLPYRNGLSSVQNDLWTLRAWMARDRLDVAHFPANYGFGPPGARTVITLHDEINVMPWWEIVRGHRKDLRTMIMMTYLHACSTAAVRRAHLLITVSEYARRQIARYSRFPADRIVPVHHAPTPDLVALYEVASTRLDQANGQAFNVGGRPVNSLIIWSEFRPLLEELIGRPVPVAWVGWRPGDQPVFISDNTQAAQALGWATRIAVRDGLRDLWDWMKPNPKLFH